MPLLSVCRHWYDVTTTCPELWCDIRVWVTCVAKWRDPVAGLSLVLSRAGKMDLHIAFDGCPVKDQEGNVVDDVSELALALLEVLMKHSAQWRTIHLFDIDAASMCALDGVCTNLPRLLEVIIQQPEAGETLTLAYISAPLLKNLFVIFSDNSANVMPCTPLQSQLTQFKVRGAHYDSSLVDMLRDCLDLKKLELQSSMPSPRVDKRVTSYTTALVFSGFFSDLTLVDLPRLRELSIGSMTSTSLDIILPSLLDLIKNSRCPLETLELVNSDLAGLVPFLELVNLTILFALPPSSTLVAGIDRALSSLMTDLEKVDLVPNLRKLQLVFELQKDDLSSELTFFKHEDVTKMLQRRSDLKACGRFLFEGDCIRQEGWVDL
ncbi:hypothetical protein BDZ89DRAFT_717894 [Hymenopellis radicata]|nr:hypothetical protein BDZ89DRAFT_717894 [Hymenopellis radicata]